MKLSISLTEDDVAALDRYAHAAGLRSRSAAVQRAIRLLGDPELDDAYAEAWDEWMSSGDSTAWESTSGDGLVDAAR
jgi:Arc/MetJ-type ribon-helix-helix transcriptional regulator